MIDNPTFHRGHRLLHPRVGAVASAARLTHQNSYKGNEEKCSFFTYHSLHPPPNYKSTMKLFTAIATLFLATLVAAQSLTNCGTGPTGMTVSSASITPYPLCAGQQVCFTITGTLNEPITQGATFTILGKYLGRIVYTDTHDLCTLLAAQGYPCPVLIATSITICVLVRSNAPVVSERSMRRHLE